jgi:hypothetical protein
MHKFIAITLFCLISQAGLTAASAATPLEQSMKKMAKAYHQLDKDLKTPVDASKPDYLALAATMKTEAQNSRTLVPKLIAALPAEQQPTQIAAYQKSIDDLGATIDVLSSDLTASNWTDATAQIAKLKSQMIDGHKKFRKPEGHGPAPAAAPAATPAPAPAPAMQ